MSVAQRTRTGCWTCRGRSVKCDEQRPTCQKCQKAGLSCSYGMRLTWVEDSIARGTCHGREGVVCKNKKKQQQAANSSPSPRRRSVQPHSPGKTQGATHTITKSKQDTRFFINTSYDDVVFYLQTDESDSRGYKDSKAKKPKKSSGISPARHANDGQCLDIDDVLACEDVLEEDSFNGLSSMQGDDDGMSLGLTRLLSGRWAPLFGNISPTESHLLDFYTAIVCSKATILDERDHNPFRFILLPMAMASTRVYHGLLAVAAGKLAATGKDCQALALMYRQYALGGLRQFLSTIRTEPQDLLDALASAISLCWFEIADHCQPTWTDHLAAISILLDACITHPAMPDSSRDIIRFAWQYFAYHLVMAKTTFPIHEFVPKSSATSSICDQSTSEKREASPETFEIRDQVLASYGYDPPASDAPATFTTQVNLLRTRYGLDPTKNAYVDAHQGFSNTLLFLIDEICELRSAAQATSSLTEEDRSVSATEVAGIVHRIEQELVSLRQLPPKPYWFEENDGLFSDLFSEEPAQPTQDSNRTRIMETTAEAHRLGAILFLDETCALYWPEIVPQSRAFRSKLVDQVIDLSLNIGSEYITAAFPIWAVFIAGCMAYGDKQRQRILGIFSLLETTMFRSMPPARKVVEMVWRQQDLTVDENPRVAASWDGPFRIWKRAADHLTNTDGDSTPCSAADSRAQRCQKGAGKANCSSKKAAGGSSATAQFSWERAMSIFGECKLILT